MSLFKPQQHYTRFADLDEGSCFEVEGRPDTYQKVGRRRMCNTQTARCFAPNSRLRQKPVEEVTCPVTVDLRGARRHRRS